MMRRREDWLKIAGRIVFQSPGSITEAVAAALNEQHIAYQHEIDFLKDAIAKLTNGGIVDELGRIAAVNDP